MAETVTNVKPKSAATQSLKTGVDYDKVTIPLVPKAPIFTPSEEKVQTLSEKMAKVTTRERLERMRSYHVAEISRINRQIDLIRRSDFVAEFAALAYEPTPSVVPGS